MSNAADPGPAAQVFVVLVQRDGAWRPYDWRNDAAAAARLIARLVREGTRARLEVKPVRG
ncbi:MAG: hypothetical protein ABI624_10060 [Casimicrobiaceae bacterium]